MKVSLSAHFITLTYADQNIPIVECYKNDQPLYLPTLVKKDFQNFMKRLRKLQPAVPIKYYACGEYGGRTGRPHYHAIILNSDIEKIYKAWAKAHFKGFDKNENPEYDYDPIGIINRGEVTPASIAYTVKYMQKDSWLDVGKFSGLDPGGDLRQREFSLMSKGLGKSYVTPAIIKYHNADLNRGYVKMPGGNASVIPRYLKEKIYPLKGIELRGPTQIRINELELQKRIDHSKTNSPNSYEVDDFNQKRAKTIKIQQHLSKKRNKI